MKRGVHIIEILTEKMMRKKVREGHFDFTGHAMERMAEREIEIGRVLECILSGKVIEFQQDKKTHDLKVLFQENSKHKAEIYVVVAAQKTPLIITVCRTKDEVWDWIDNVLRRREVYRR